MTVKFIYDSVEEMTKNAIVSQVNQHHVDEETRMFHGSVEINWYGLPKKDLLETINNGWTEGVRKAKEFKDLIEKDIKPLGIKRRRKHGEEGEEIDLDKFLLNEFDSMFISTEKTLTIKPNSPISIHVNLASHYRREAKDFFWKGAVAAALTDLLENAGYRVKLSGFMHLLSCYEENPFGGYVEMLIKDYNAPLDFERIVTTTALSGFFRWYGIRTIWSHTIRVTSGSGFPTEYLPQEVKTDILISNIYDATSALLFTDNIIKKLIDREGEQA